MKKLVKATEKNIKLAAGIIKKGGLVAFPTETVYGLGADALNPEAVVKIFEAKKRPQFNPLIIHVADLGQLKMLCKNINKTALKLIKHFWPGPLTLILEKKNVVPDIVTSGLDTVAIRMPSHPVAISLLKKAKTPIAAPSANKFGYITPTKADMILKQLKEKVNIILDDGHTHIGVESTIISVVKKPVILRPGGLSREKIEQIIGKVKTSKVSTKIMSPGQLKKHYSPHTNMEFITNKTHFPLNKKSGLLLFKMPIPEKYKGKFKNIEILSPDGDLHEAAKNLFSLLYKLDQQNLDKIYVQKVPEKHIGIAIMDRLRKAAHK